MHSCDSLASQTFLAYASEQVRSSESVQTIPGKGWFMILRLYGSLEPWFNQTWMPGDIVRVR